MTFTLPLKGWKNLNWLTSFIIIRLNPESRKYEVLSVSAMKLNMVQRKFASRYSLSEMTGLGMLSRALILLVVLQIAVLTYLH